METKTQFTHNPVSIDEKEFFLKPCHSSDAILKVDGTKYYVNKTVLSLASPVFQQMFFGDFKERDITEFELPGSSSEDILELLCCIYPSIPLHFDTMLTLCEEYQIDHLKKRCEDMAITYVRELSLSKDKLVHILYMADVYKLDNMLEYALDKGHLLNQFGENGLHEVKEFGLISSETLRKLAVKRLQYLETKVFDDIL